MSWPTYRGSSAEWEQFEGSGIPISRLGFSHEKPLAFVTTDRQANLALVSSGEEKEPLVTAAWRGQGASGDCSFAKLVPVSIAGLPICMQRDAQTVD